MYYKIMHLNLGKGIGGAEQHLVTLLRKIDKIKFNSIVVINKENKKLLEILKTIDNLNIYTIPCNGNFNFITFYKLYNIIHNEGINIIHSHLNRSDWYCKVLKLVFKIDIKIISTIHGDLTSFREKKLIHHMKMKLHKHLLQETDKIIAVSENTKEQLQNSLNVSDDKIKVIYNGVDSIKFTPNKNAKKVFEAEDESILVGIIGRLSVEKGHEVFLKAAKCILHESNSKETNFIIVGCGAEENRLKLLAKEFNIEDNVVFAGFRKDIYEILNEIDILVVSSYTEALPMVILEAMSMKKPIISSDVGGIRELLVDEQSEFLFKAGEYRKLAIKLKKLIENEKLRYKLGSFNRNLCINKFTQDVMIKQIENLYNKC